MMKLTDHPSLDDAIQALADCQLGWEEEKTVRAFLEDDPQARKLYNKITEQNKLLRHWWQTLAPRHN